MAHQLIYTSAPQGLQAGRSGYCTVAHSRGLRERLILPLEQYSNFTHLVLPGQESTVRNPTIHLYRKFTLAGTEYRILSRIVDAGADHTGRSNFLAHHLVFEGDWRGLPSPAAILRYWPGWKDRWDDAPGYIDEISPGELEALGQADNLPTANNEEYLAKGWETPFTTFQQEGDAKADFEWMGTRDAPDPGKRIGVLSGTGLEGQARTLDERSGVISAPDADERKLLDVFAFALGQRSQAAEQEALGQAREALDTENEKIERLARQIETSIGETQGKVDAYRQQYEARCETGDASRLYQNCLQDHIKPAREKVENHRATFPEVMAKAEAGYKAAKEQLDSHRFPDTGIDTRHLAELEELSKNATDCEGILDKGIQAFEDKLNEHNRTEQLRLAKEREETLKQAKIRRTSGGRPVGTAADYAYPTATPNKTRFGIMGAVIAVAVVLMVAVAAISYWTKEPDNPIVYSGIKPNEKWLSFHLHVEKNKMHKFYGFRDTNDILHDSEINWATKTPQERATKIEAEYGNDKGNLNYIEWTNEGQGKYMVGRSTNDGFDTESASGDKHAIAKEIVNELIKQHESKFLKGAGKKSIKTQYELVQELCKGPSKGNLPSTESPSSSEKTKIITALNRLQTFDRFVIDGKQESRLKDWKKTYKEAEGELEKEFHGESSENNEFNTEGSENEEEVKNKIKQALTAWRKAIIAGVITHVGDLPVDYRDVEKIKSIDDKKTIKEWLDQYVMRGKKITELNTIWEHSTDYLTEKTVKIKLAVKFNDVTGEPPGTFKKLLDGRERFINERDIAVGLYNKKTMTEINNMKLGVFWQDPIKPANGVAVKRDYQYNQGRYTLELHFVFEPSLNDYQVNEVDFKIN